VKTSRCLSQGWPAITFVDTPTVGREGEFRADDGRLIRELTLDRAGTTDHGNEAGSCDVSASNGLPDSEHRLPVRARGCHYLIVNAVERFFAASRAHDVDAAVSELAPDVVMLNPATDDPLVGREAVADALRSVEAACDEFRHTHLLHDPSYLDSGAGLLVQRRMSRDDERELRQRG
jgi:hypothetical protein